MSSSLVPVIIVLVIAAAIAIAMYAAKVERERKAAFAAVAARRGWTFDPQGDPRWIDAFSENPFSVGHARRVGCALTGSDRDRNVAAFDYTYFTTETSTTSDGKGGTTTTTREQAHHFRVAVVATGLSGPALSLGGENWLIRAFDAIGGGDIDFESETFNRRFRVHCNDRKFAYDVITQQTMDALLAFQPERLVWEAGWLMWADNGRWNPLEIEATFANLHAIVDCIPKYLREQGATPEPPQA